MREDRYTRAWPELGLLDSSESRKQLLRTCRRRMLWRSLLFSALFWVVAPVTRFLIVPHVTRSLGVFKWIPAFWGEMLVTMYLGSAIVLPIAMLNRKRLRRLIRQELHNRRISVCMECGYDLRGQVEPRCPECGRPMN